MDKLIEKENNDENEWNERGKLKWSKHRWRERRKEVRMNTHSKMNDAYKRKELR